MMIYSPRSMNAMILNLLLLRIIHISFNYMYASKNIGTNSYFFVQVIIGNTEIKAFELKFKKKIKKQYYM